MIGCLNNEFCQKCGMPKNGLGLWQCYCPNMNPSQPEIKITTVVTDQAAGITELAKQVKELVEVLKTIITLNEMNGYWCKECNKGHKH